MIQIEHNNYGSGIIRKQRYGGFEYYIEFSDGISRWLRRDEITLLTEPKILSKHKAYERQIPQDQFTARKAIEALRLGIVPHDSIETFTIGRDKEIKQLTKWFDNSKAGSLFIRGEYGSGKSHLLEYIQSWALKNNWATSTVEIGLEENPFYKPYQIYREIIRSFRYRQEGKVYGFRDLLRYIVECSDADMFESHLFFQELLLKFEVLRLTNEKNTTLENGDKNQLQKGNRYKKRGKNITEERIWDWIEGENNWFKPSLSQTGTAANLYCYIINALSWSISNLLNLNGLVILFDEAEYIDDVSYKYQCELGSNFLNGIIALSDNNESLLTEKISLERKRGYKTGLIYCGYPLNNPIRYAWKYPAGLKVIFAVTPIPTFENKNKIDLQMLKNDDLLTIAYNVVQFYKRAYGIEISDEIVNRLVKKLHKYKIRLFIKYSVEILDLLRFHPDTTIEGLL